MLGLPRRALLGFGLGMIACASLAGCGGSRSRVSFVSNERPSGYAAAQGSPPPAAAHQENPNGTVDLGEDDFLEPEHPAADTKQERALVHIHGPKDVVCSGVVLGPRIVATAQRCLRGQGKGASSLGPDREYRVEVASSTLTWTNRRAKYAVLPQCDETELDIAILILEEAVPSLVVPLKVASAPNTGARVQALGFGHCAGSSATTKERTGTVRSRVSQAVIIDVPLCKGDVGGPVIDGRDGEVVGLISHRDDPEGSPLKTATIARLDTVWARDLIAQARLLSEGADSAKVQSVACR
ncbi:MAG: putative serine protease [Labilithrix sp.]|nr:putative serine protease [Labilithrix sp.]